MAERTNLSMLIIIALTTGVGAASVNIAARFASDPGDVLGFAGGALGAGLAVIGAYYLERLRSHNSAKTRIRMAGEAFTILYRQAGQSVNASNFKRIAWSTQVSLRLAETMANNLNTENTFLVSSIGMFEDSLPLIKRELQDAADSDDADDDSLKEIRAKSVRLCLKQIRRGIDLVVDENNSTVEKGFWPRDVYGAIQNMRAAAGGEREA